MDTINELAKALATAQGQIKGAAKDVNNTFFKSKYADLASCWEACREPLSTNGLAIWQHLRHVEGNAYLLTTLYHESGQSLTDDGIPLLLGKQDMQAMGSAITYARRYGLMAAVGIAPEDDDGNSAVAGEGSSPVKASVKDNGQAKSGPVTKTKKEIEAFLQGLSRWSDADTLQGYLDDNVELLDRCKADIPSWWSTKPGSDVMGVEDRIKAKRVELSGF